MYGHICRDWQDAPRWELDKLSVIHHRQFVSANEQVIVSTYKHREDVRSAIKHVDSQLEGYAERCRAEGEIVDYLDGLLSHHYHRQLAAIASSMADCHKHGTQGVHKESGRSVTLWDHKCGVTRLCPHEGRNETHRIIERYLPAIQKHLEPSGNRAYSCVFTLPNYAPGQLKKGLKHIYTRFKRLIKSRKDIVGALCVVEAPLSADDDWNVHLNCILLTKGYLDFGAIRRQWYWNVEFAYLDKRPESIGGALKEIIKYAVKLTPEKSMQKAESGETVAPALTEWPHERFLEWWESHQRYRRVRSYNGLYLTKARREELGLDEPETRTIDESEITIIGRVEWIENRYHFTPAILNFDLIREDNFFHGEGKSGRTGPPGPH